MKLLESLITLLYKKYRPNRVQFERDLPPEFIISDHAATRMKERIGCSEDKMMKLCIKAWHCHDKVSQRRLNNWEYGKKYNSKRRHYRACMGYIFVYASAYCYPISNRQKTLVTILNNKK